MKKLLYINLIFAILLFSTGCKKGFLTDLAVNPNQPSQAPASLILPSILTGYASNVYFSETTMGLWMGYYSISGGYAVSDNGETYYVSAAGPDLWDSEYGILKNAAYMEQTAANDPNGQYSVAVAKILKAWGFQAIADAYGMAPYTQAFKGSQNFFPKYDDAKTIYDSSIADLDVAINMIETAPSTASNLGSNDIMFGGDMDQWAKFANTLKLRFIVRQSNVISASDAQSELAKTASVGYLTSDALVNPGYLNTDGKQSPLWASFGTTAGGSLHSDGFNYLKAGGAAFDFFANNNDPRLFYVYAPDGVTPDKAEFFTTDTNPNHYHGVYYGDRQTATDQGTNGTAGVGHGIMSGPGASVPLMLSAESNFLQSEAALRGWITADAQALYIDGINSSFEYLYTAAGEKKEDADAAATNYDTTRAGNVSIQNIITQKWAALAGINPFEAWNEYRRTGYPPPSILPLTKYPGNTRQIPTRLMFPTSEQNTNQDNYKAAVAQGNDPQSTKVFWMK
ncbi:MAG: SusD/RagB family nutrient-binding outer membrane lipoprotein [Ginsengibacter sp.]